MHNIDIRLLKWASVHRTVGEVMAGIVAKCISAPKTKTRELALQIVLLYIEIEKHEAVQEELLKGMDHKNPKTVSSCIAAMTQALRYVMSLLTCMLRVQKLLVSKKTHILFI